MKRRKIDPDTRMAAMLEGLGGESSNGKLRDELLKGEIFYTPKKAQTLIERR